MSEPGPAPAPESLRDRLGDHFGPAVVAGLIAISLVAAALIAMMGPIRGPDGAVVDAAGTTAPGAPADPNGGAPKPTIPELAPLDNFDRADGGLGSTTTGLEWTTMPTDSFVINSNEACSMGGETTPAVAVVESTSARDIGMSARMTKIDQGAGIVVHFLDDKNYISLVAIPRVAGWRLQVVQDGSVTLDKPAPLTAASDGVEIGLIVSGGQAAIAADGEVTAVIPVPADVDPGGTKAGLILSKAGTAACWDDIALRTPG